MLQINISNKIIVDENRTGIRVALRDNITQEYAANLWAALVSIRTLGPTAENFGICFNVTMENSGVLPDATPVFKAISTLSRGWPKYSGSESFPVSHETINAGDAYVYITNKWDKETVYGRDRWELLDFLIERCQQIAWPGRA